MENWESDLIYMCSVSLKVVTLATEDPDHLMHPWDPPME